MPTILVEIISNFTIQQHNFSYHSLYAKSSTRTIKIIIELLMEAFTMCWQELHEYVASPSLRTDCLSLLG
jgi:hypothetical protein